MLMVAAMLLLPVVDGSAKYLTGFYSVFFICWARYAAASVVAIPIAVARHGWRFLPRDHITAHMLRTVFLVLAMLAYFRAISSVPLADAISAYFVSPIIATLLAVLLLGERLSVIKALALGLGFAGTIIIVRPGGAVEPGLLYALAAGLLFAGYIVATRQTAQSTDPVKILAFQCGFGALILLPGALWAWPPAFGPEAWLLALMGVVSTLAHLLSITAFRYADASTLSPLLYVELLGSVLVGYLFFGDLPGVNVWLGAAAIVAGGILLIRRPTARRT